MRLKHSHAAPFHAAAILVLLAIPAQPVLAADAKAGAVVFARCAICHSNTKGAADRLGPNLFGVVGHKAGSRPNFSYSPAMRNSDFVWNNDRLKAYIASPAKVVPGNRMAFAGIGDAGQRDDLVSYLDTLK